MTVERLPLPLSLRFLQCRGLRDTTHHLPHPTKPLLLTSGNACTLTLSLDLDDGLSGPCSAQVQILYKGIKCFFLSFG